MTLIKKTSFRSLLIAVISISILGYASDMTEYQFRHLETNDFQAKEIHQQIWMSDGTFYSTTEGGLMHSNGFQSKYYNTENQSIISDELGGLQRTGENEIWITYRDTNFITLFKPEEQTFKHFEIKSLLSEEGIMDALVVRIKKSPSGELWLCTWGAGLVKFDTNTKQEFSYEFRKPESVKDEGIFVKDIVIENEDKILVTFFNGRVGTESYPCWFYPKTGSFEWIDIEQYIQNKCPHLQRPIDIAIKIIHWVHKDNYGKYWLGSYSGILYMDVENETIERIHLPQEDPIITNLVNSPGYTVDGDILWLSTYNRGLGRINTATKELSFIENDSKNPASLHSNKVTSVSIDPFKNIWVINGIGNISIIHPFIHQFKMIHWDDLNLKFTNASAQNIPVHMFFVRNSNEIYISHRDGILVIKSSNQEQTRYEFKSREINPVKQRGVEDFKIIGDSIYFYFDTKMYRAPLKQIENYKQLPDSFGGELVAKHDKNENQLYTLRGHHTYGVKLSRIHENLTEIEEIATLPLGVHPSGPMSFKTNNGYHIFSEKFGRFILANFRDSTFKLFSPSSSYFFPDSTVRCGHVFRKNEILIGTNLGIYSFDEITYETTLLNEHFGIEGEEIINAIVEDNNGCVWIATETELLCWNPSNDEHYRYGRTLGINVTQFLPSVAQKDENGRLYFATMKGILHFNPTDVIFPNHSIELFIQDVTIHGNKLTTSALADFLEGKTVLDYSDNFLKIEFYTSQMYELGPHNYFYKLSGLNEEWIDLKNQHSVRFDNLSHGSYTLHLKVKNSFGVESKEVLIPFTINKPFWLKWWFIIAMIMLGIGIVLLIVRMRLRKLKQRSEQLEKMVDIRTQEVVEQKKEADHQRKIVEEKQKEITDSITYAKRIQEAILPASDLINGVLEENFVLYLPKDIVAGDFYWLEIINKDEFLIAVADCTGHGVPGAMVSVVCNNALKRSAREFALKNPAAILDQTRSLIVEQFKENQNNSSIKDGMDIGLCYINKKKRIIEFSGAHNALFLVRNGELIEFSADKQPVGQFEYATPFTSHSIAYQKDDLFYLYSDGFADQFGGDKGKKFKSANFKKLLTSFSTKPLISQEQELLEVFESWKGNFEQLDDVCVLGFKLT